MGRLILRVYHRPRQLAAQCALEGGPLEQIRTRSAKAQMIVAAEELGPLQPLPEAFGVGASFLTGQKYWHETLFCMTTFQANSQKLIPFRVYDDGSLSLALQERIRSVIGWAEIITSEQIACRLEEVLPIRRFPSLRRRRITYPHLRKLTDIHIFQQDWSLTLDSDMLFFRPPLAVLRWLQQPAAAIYMQDIETSYGYSDSLLQRLSGGPILPKVNVGLYGLKSSTIDWEEVEYWCSTQLEEEGDSYFQEQALTAMLISNRLGEALPATDYVVCPSPREGSQASAILHHYVAESKISYYRHGWQKALELLPDRRERVSRR